ncbi:MAG: hypothetical protein IIA05_12405 [Proteobacteria bacterium]|nr:hypothetical protein [Pseudomonadota bacterium]
MATIIMAAVLQQKPHKKNANHLSYKGKKFAALRLRRSAVYPACSPIQINNARIMRLNNGPMRSRRCHRPADFASARTECYLSAGYG